MISLKHLFLSAAAFAGPITALAALTAGQTSTAVNDPSFRTIRVIVNDDFMAPAIIRLGSSDRLTVSFDEISDEPRQLQYRLIHCNADWTESRLTESEYLDGFNIADIEDCAFSSNTFVHYLNYRIDIPSADMNPLVSGNYLLQVFDRFDPDKVLLQTRFCVTENIVEVSGLASSYTDRGVNDRLQQLSVRLGDIGQTGNPFQDLIVNISQNRRPETTHTLTHPSRVENNAVIFEHDPALIFHAGNEYRRFEVVRLDYPGMNIDSLRFGGSNYHAWLTPDQTRADSEYCYDQTQNGRFLIREHNSTDSDLGADYVTIHFTLDHPWLPGEDIYVDGDFTYHRFTSANRMVYNPTTGIYELQMPLKQGAYNYQYVTLPRSGTGIASVSEVEGDKFETRNEYLVQVYLRTPGSRADRMIGQAIITDPTK